MTEEDIVCDGTEAYQCQLALYGSGYYVTRASGYDVSNCDAQKTCSSQSDCSEGYCIAEKCVEEVIVTVCSSNSDCAEEEICLPEYDICYAEPIVSCSDTDSSNDPAVLGEIYGISFTDLEEAEGEEDICADDGTGVWEFYCDEESDYITAEFVACDEGMICSEGICKEMTGTRCAFAADCSDDYVCAPYTDTCQEEPTTVCVDTDETNDPYTAGTISGTSDYSFTDLTDWADRCSPDRHSVVEYYCHESGYVAAEKVACETDEFCNPISGTCEQTVTSGISFGSEGVVELESRETEVASADMSASSSVASRMTDVAKTSSTSSGTMTMSSSGIGVQGIMTRTLKPVLVSTSTTSYKTSSIFNSGITAGTS